jgi:MoaA/NifB/PqqE/SkfB family radical SAM enzyme
MRGVMEAGQRAVPRVTFLELEITGKCQLACVHCYADSGPSGTHGTMAIRDWQRLIDEAAAMGVRTVQFIGGEPTLHPDLCALIRYTIAAGLRVEVFSNMVHVTPEQWAVFALPEVSLATSYYGGTAAGHEAVTGRRGSHARTRANIAEAVRRGIPLRAGIIGAPESQIVEAARADLAAAGVRNIGTDRMRGVGRAAADLVTVRELCGQCGHGRAAISSQGEVWPCVIGRFMTAGNVKGQRLADVVGGPRMAAIRAMIPQPLAPCNPDDTDCQPNAEVCYPAYCNPDKGEPDEQPSQGVRGGLAGARQAAG